MSGKTLAAVLAALTLVGTSGCQTGAGSSSAGLFSGRGDRAAEDQLSPEFEEARKTFRRNTPKALLAWARYQEDVGEYAEALRRYRELTIAYPENIEAHLGLARVENTTGRFEQAEGILRKLATEHPDNTQIRLELGQLYSQREDWNSATAAFEQACRLTPHDQTCRYELGVAMARSGLLEQALPHLTFAVGGPAAHYNVGYLLHEQGRDEEAAEWLQRALELHPDQKTADQSRRLLAQLGSSEQSRVAAAPAKPRREVLPAAARRQVGVIEDESEEGSGVRQAAWVGGRPAESRLKGLRRDQQETAEDEAAAAAAAAVEDSGAQATGSSDHLASPRSAAPTSLDPPKWKSSKPVLK
ncbi:MAG: tetratricopeptide repeat protein [Planctomycetaceae bacterium]